MNGYKMQHGLPLDPRLAVAAKRAGLRRGEVLALWVTLLDYASQNTPRGAVRDVDPERIAVMLEFDTAEVTAALKAFRDKNLISADGLLTGWKESQSLSSTLRVREHRARRREETLARLEKEGGDADAARRRQRLSHELADRHKKRGRIMADTASPPK